MESLLPLTLPPAPERPADSHKGTYGSVLVIAGSARFPGAAVLTALGAGRAGAGLVRMAVPSSILPWIVPAVPFATVRACKATSGGGLAAAAIDDVLDEAASSSSVVVGPGLGRDPGTGELLAALVANVAAPMVLDADALNLLAPLPAEFERSALSRRPGPTVLTPHPGEFARLTSGNLPAHDERAPRAAALARTSGAVVVLKGHHSVVTDGRRVWVEPAGNAGMATGGMGDVLAGVIGALMAVVEPVAEATALAVHVHALAGDLCAQELGEEGVLPEDVALRLGRVLRAQRHAGRAGYGPVERSPT